MTVGQLIHALNFYNNDLEVRLLPDPTNIGKSPLLSAYFDPVCLLRVGGVALYKDSEIDVLVIEEDF